MAIRILQTTIVRVLARDRIFLRWSLIDHIFNALFRNLFCSLQLALQWLCNFSCLSAPTLECLSVMATPQSPTAIEAELASVPEGAPNVSYVFIVMGASVSIEVGLLRLHVVENI